MKAAVGARAFGETTGPRGKAPDRRASDARAARRRPFIDLTKPAPLSFAVATYYHVKFMGLVRSNCRFQGRTT
ncbi:hypothetical protein NUV25_30040 [Burkholderia pseudomultivorans]|uniref:hypothetical protein n=1 Tax=Burkholderia pseudomultivorans TaxID=1207504 RepID=UPI002875316F|nr:hypothetical protein [Burkholderia pseudomultivorans]MDS0861958.1 hypothetical protein [Burkholderia pseudomultivorans]